MCKKEGPTPELRAEFPEPDYSGDHGGRCWDMTTAVKLWEHPDVDGPGVHYEISGHIRVGLAPERALAIACGLKPKPAQDLKLAQRQVADIIRHQLDVAHGTAEDVAAQIAQVLPMLGREDG